jgi:List-Bact-rpt repeat protein/putative Ig domain-containing protein
MKGLLPLSLAIGLMAFGPRGAGATTVIGDLNNFDTLNDTGQVCYGFEIEIDDIHSTDITYTYDWNHYGAPKIREDNTDPLHPKVFVRYESTKDSNGSWGANGSFTNQAIPTITPPAGHTCTDPTVNEGCEHFGVGYYGVPTSIKYNWLIDSGGTLVYFGTPVGVATPTWTYTPPAPAQPAQVVAVIPAPVVPNLVGLEFGEPSWVKVIKTTTHNANKVALQNLVSADGDGDGLADWQNSEPDQVETEWQLLQVNNSNPAKNELAGGADDMGDGSETVTRRYEFYRYGADPNTLDGETGEAMCSEVNPTTDANDPNYLHGVGDNVAVTDANGDTYYVNCAAQVVVGNYIGAQMAGFDAAAPLGLVDHLQDGESGVPYTPRTVVVGGNSPYVVTVPHGSLPPGLSIGDYVDPQTGLTLPGVLSGTPTAGGDFTFTIEAADADNVTVSAPYSLHIIGAPVQQLQLGVNKVGSGTGTVAGNNIDCGATCSTFLDSGTSVSLSATPDPDCVFGGWSGPCTGTGGCSFTLAADTTVTATFIQQWLLSVATSGGGTGTVTGNGIDCGNTCSIMLDDGTAVSLTATPTNGSVFTGWSGDCSGPGTCDTTMTAARSVSATFVPPTQQYTMSVTRTGSGTVTSSPKGISCGKHCSKSYTVGTSVTLTAKPAKKHAFLGWTGACSGTSLTCTVSMLGDQSVGADFN